MAKSLEALVQGEIMQLQSTADERLSLEYYLTKSYCKTASLMAFSCKRPRCSRATAIESDVAVAAEKFGYHFGLAWGQVIDDLLDFSGTSDTLGKPGLQDMALGLSIGAGALSSSRRSRSSSRSSRASSREDGDVQKACEPCSQRPELCQRLFPRQAVRRLEARCSELDVAPRRCPAVPRRAARARGGGDLPRAGGGRSVPCSLPRDPPRRAARAAGAAPGWTLVVTLSRSPAL